jgi:hypothetical protein
MPFGLTRGSVRFVKTRFGWGSFRCQTPRGWSGSIGLTTFHSIIAEFVATRIQPCPNQIRYLVPEAGNETARFHHGS